jgi:folate-binding protein YgfZ
MFFESVVPMPLSLSKLRNSEALGYAWLNDELAPFWLEGLQALDYMQRRTSQQLSQLKAGEGKAAALLNKQAHLQALVSVHVLEANAETGERLLGLCERSQLEATETAIRQFKIMEPFTLGRQPVTSLDSNKAEPSCLWLVGEGLSEIFKRFALSLAWPAFSFKENACAEFSFQGQPLVCVAFPFLMTGRVLNLPNLLLVGDTFTLEAFLQAFTTFLEPTQLKLEALPKEDRHVYELEVGLPRFGKAYTGSTLLPETGLESWTVSYSKGCYLGQETIARVKTYGSVPRLLVGLVFAEQPQAALYTEMPCPLYLLGESKPVGQLVQVAYSQALQAWLGLAYLNKTHRVPSQKLTLHFHPDALPSASSPALEATVQWLPFVGESPSLQEASAQHTLSSSLQETLNLALQQFLNGETEPALELLKQTRLKHPHCHELSETLGVLLGRLNRYEEAMAVMQAIVEQDPTWVMAYTNLSRFALALGDKELAEVYKAQATTASMKRHMQQAMAKKAQVAASAKETELSQEEVLAKQAQEAQAALKRREQLQERAALFRHALQFNETDPLAHYGLATTLLDLAEPAQALPHLQRTVALQPKQSQAYLSLAQAYEQTGHPTLAIETLKQGLEVAAARGDKQPLQQMEAKLLALSGLGVL